MGKLEGKAAVITGGSSGMALASAKRFVEEGAYVFITGRRQEQLDEAVKAIGRNVTAVRGDAAKLSDLDHLFDTVKREKGKIDILFASAGTGEPLPLGQITEEHFDAAFDLNVRGTLFTVQKALPLISDGGSIIMTGSNASAKGFPGFGVYAASKLALRSEMITVELGGRTVEIRHLGFAQTPGDLVVWVPDAKVLWVGNMIQAPSPALPWLLEGRHHDTIDTLSRVKEFLPDDATIIPGHGKPMRPSDIDFPLNYLRELDGSVRKTLDEGRSAEEAQDAVAMAHYRDYSLFEWAHKTVNIPAAYSHLQSKTT